jgi:hypothetical protein
LNTDKPLFWLQKTPHYRTATEQAQRTVELNTPEKRAAAFPFLNS